MSIHVAILQKSYLDAILAGTKTIESRLTRTAREPFDAIDVGDRLFLKQSAGPFRAMAIASRVKQFADLTPERVERLQQKYQKQVGGDDAYWASKRDSRFAVFVSLDAVEPFSVGPSYVVQTMRAWYALPDAESPLREYVLTSGAIRNSYASLPGTSDWNRVSGLTLLLPDGREIRTELSEGRRLRWRGWAELYANAGVRPGDRLRFIAAGKGRFVVSFPDTQAEGAT